MDWTAVSALVALFTIGGGGIGWLGNIAYRRGSLDRADRATAMAGAAALQKIEEVLRHFTAHQIEDARSFAKLEAMIGETARVQAAADIRLAKALDDFGGVINRMTDRIDRVLDAREA